MWHIFSGRAQRGQIKKQMIDIPKTPIKQYTAFWLLHEGAQNGASGHPGVRGPGSHTEPLPDEDSAVVSVAFSVRDASDSVEIRRHVHPQSFRLPVCELLLVSGLHRLLQRQVRGTVSNRSSRAPFTFIPDDSSSLLGTWLKCIETFLVVICLLSSGSSVTRETTKLCLEFVTKTWVC